MASRPVPNPLATMRALIAQGHPQARSLDPGFSGGVPPQFVQSIRNAFLSRMAPAAVRPAMAGEHGAGVGIAPQAVRPDMAGEHGGGLAPGLSQPHVMPPEIMQRLQQLIHGHSQVGAGRFGGVQYGGFQPPPNPFNIGPAGLTDFSNPADGPFPPMGGAAGPRYPVGGWSSVDTFQPYQPYGRPPTQGPRMRAY